MVRQSGVTLIELIATLVIVGIIAVMAVPRFFDRSAFDNRTFRDEVVSGLRYAQKKAIASRRNVCVAFTLDSLTLTTASAHGTNQPCDTPISDARGSAAYVIRAKRQAAFAALPAPAAWAFDSQGQPSGGTHVIQIQGNPVITVNGTTGYVE